MGIFLDAVIVVKISYLRFSVAFDFVDHFLPLKKCYSLLM